MICYSLITLPFHNISSDSVVRQDNIKMDLQAVGCGVMDWIKLAQDRDRWQALVNVLMNLWVPLNVENFLIS